MVPVVLGIPDRMDGFDVGAKEGRELGISVGINDKDGTPVGDEEGKVLRFIDGFCDVIAVG